MLYRILADVAVMLHFSFIVFVFLGGFLALRWPRVAWIHVPAFLWGSAISLFGWTCPITYLENELRAKGGAEGYSTSFIEEHVLPLVYPEQLVGGFPESGFIAIGVFIVALNALIYWHFAVRLRQGISHRIR